MIRRWAKSLMLGEKAFAHQPKSFDWRARQAKPHPWGGIHPSMLKIALEKFDTICGISELNR
jgi:hypothetical protein